MPLLDKAEVLYFEPESIGSADGAHCGICWKFDPFAFRCFEVMGSINGASGICGLYVNGEPIGQKLSEAFEGTPRRVTKREAGYSEAGPTHCGNCDEMIVRAVYTTSPCKKVTGMVDGRACCNVWQKK